MMRINAPICKVLSCQVGQALAASDLHYALLGGLPSAYRSQDRDGKTHHEKPSAKVTQRSRRADYPARVNTIGSQSPVRLLAAAMTNPGTYRCRTRKVTL